MGEQTSTAPSWLQPAQEQQGLKRYLDVLRERAWIVIACFVVCLGLSILYVAFSDRVYEARADLLITPVPAESETLVSLGLLRETNDPAREVDTATLLVTTTPVAERVAEDLGLDRSPQELIDSVKAEPVARSNIVSITAQAGSPEEARDLADAFGNAAVEQRTDELHARIEEVLPDLRSQFDTLPADQLTAQELAAQIAQLETLLASPDPTMALETPAVTASDPVAPRPLLTIVGGGLFGIVLGVALSFAVRLLDPRLRREEQLGELFRLPVLARVPNEPSKSSRPLRRENLSAPSIEAYRTLRARLTSGVSPGESRSVMVTGPSASGGKTTTAINLATALAATESSVILVEADARRPSIGKAFGIESSSRGLFSALLEESTLEQSLVEDSRLANVRMLLAEATGPDIAELVSLPVMGKLIQDAKRLADYVVVDCPPMTEVIDALPLAVDVDDVLIVVRLGKSMLRQTKELGELLAGVGVTPAGIVVVGVERRGSSYYYQQDHAERRRLWRSPGQRPDQRRPEPRPQAPEERPDQREEARPGRRPAARRSQRPDKREKAAPDQREKAPADQRVGAPADQREEAPPDQREKAPADQREEAQPDQRPPQRPGASPRVGARGQSRRG